MRTSATYPVVYLHQAPFSVETWRVSGRYELRVRFSDALTRSALGWSLPMEAADTFAARIEGEDGGERLVALVEGAVGAWLPSDPWDRAPAGKPEDLPQDLSLLAHLVRTAGGIAAAHAAGDTSWYDVLDARPPAPWTGLMTSDRPLGPRGWRVLRECNRARRWFAQSPFEYACNRCLNRWAELLGGSDLDYGPNISRPCPACTMTVRRFADERELLRCAMPRPVATRAELAHLLLTGPWFDRAGVAPCGDASLAPAAVVPFDLFDDDDIPF